MSEFRVLSRRVDTLYTELSSRLANLESLSTGVMEDTKASNDMTVNLDQINARIVFYKESLDSSLKKIGELEQKVLELEAKHVCLCTKVEQIETADASSVDEPKQVLSSNPVYDQPLDDVPEEDDQ